MKSEYVLFIGGSKDGQWLDVDISLHDIQFAKFPKPIYKVGREEYKKLTLEKETYRAEYLYTTEKRYQIYVLDTMTPEVMLGTLIMGYKK